MGGLGSPPRPGPAPTRQTRNPGGAAAGGAARRRAPSAYKRTAFLLWKLSCSSVVGAKRLTYGLVRTNIGTRALRELGALRGASSLLVPLIFLTPTKVENVNWRNVDRGRENCARAS